MTRVYIVTPSFNAEATLSRTIHSVVSQAGDFDIYYHVQDGDSGDGTVALLKRWEHAVAEGAVPLSCRSLTFTWDSRPDNDMYHALALGFSRFSPRAEDWMSWINADDVLLPTALPLLTRIDGDESVSRRIDWVTGAAATCSEGCQNGFADRFHAAELIVRGIADGTHWGYVQQEGTFFRRRCWDAVDGAHAFSGLRYAGDWNLWRLMAAEHTLYQSAYSLALFSSHPAQLSQTCRQLYQAEIDRFVPKSVRRTILSEQDGESLFSHYLVTSYGSAALDVEARSLVKPLRWRKEAVFGKIGKSSPQKAQAPAAAPVRSLPDAGVSNPRVSSTLGSGADTITTVRKGNVIHFDAQWQYPAITERHAFAKVSEQLPPRGVVYFAFPWATLIDRLQCRKDDGGLRTELERARTLLRPGERVVTVCQHIRLPEFEALFGETGIDDIFWSHASRGMRTLPSFPRTRIHPFPLYPVQAVEARGGEPGDWERDVLFSFIGARANRWYLSEVRNWILEDLGQDGRGWITGRDAWHYQQIVYDHQISGDARQSEGLVDQHASADFRSTLRRSVFSLCPGGTGPNSIRLWESIGLGAIPVVLSDAWQPPGDEALWKEAVVFVPEQREAVRELPDRLEALSRDRSLLERKRHAMRQLWLLYGPECFVYDVRRLFLEGAVSAGGGCRAPEAESLLRMARTLTAPDAPDALPWDAFILGCSTRVMQDPERFLSLYRESPELRQAWRCARREGGGARLRAMDDMLRRRGVQLEEA